VCSLSLLGNGSINTFPRQRRIIEGVVFYVVHFVSKEIRHLILTRTTCLNSPSCSTVRHRRHRPFTRHLLAGACCQPHSASPSPPGLSVYVTYRRLARQRIYIPPHLVNFYAIAVCLTLYILTTLKLKSIKLGFNFKLLLGIEQPLRKTMFVRSIAVARQNELWEIGGYGSWGRFQYSSQSKLPVSLLNT
jgi:hypothetical protein